MRCKVRYEWCNCAAQLRDARTQQPSHLATQRVAQSPSHYCKDAQVSQFSRQRCMCVPVGCHQQRGQGGLQRTACTSTTGAPKTLCPGFSIVSLSLLQLNRMPDSALIKRLISHCQQLKNALCNTTKLGSHS